MATVVLPCLPCPRPLSSSRYLYHYSYRCIHPSFLLVQVPHYDFVTHTRSNPGEGTPLRGADVIIFEGLFTLHNGPIRNMLDLCLFAVEDADTCLVRRLKRDIAERGRDVASVLVQYERFVKPGYINFIAPSMNHSDIIVPRAGVNHRLIKLIVNNINRKLYPEKKIRSSPVNLIGRAESDGRTASMQVRPPFTYNVTTSFAFIILTCILTIITHFHTHVHHSHSVERLTLHTEYGGRQMSTVQPHL